MFIILSIKKKKAVGRFLVDMGNVERGKCNRGRGAVSPRLLITYSGIIVYRLSWRSFPLTSSPSPLRTIVLFMTGVPPFVVEADRSPRCRFHVCVSHLLLRRISSPRTFLTAVRDRNRVTLAFYTRSSPAMENATEIVGQVPSDEQRPLSGAGLVVSIIRFTPRLLLSLAPGRALLHAFTDSCESVFDLHRKPDGVFSHEIIIFCKQDRRYDRHNGFLYVHVYRYQWFPIVSRFKRFFFILNA